MYVTGGDKSPAGCVFCNAPANDDAESLLLYRGRTCYVLLNLYPYNNGHLMVVPHRHTASLTGLEPAERAELIDLASIAELALTEAYQPHGVNMGINLGKPAGAGIVDHIHLHVVPRWNGDTNFMTVVGSVRVLPEDLPQTAAKLRPIFARLAGRQQ